MSTPFAIERVTSAERIALCIDIVQARGIENARRSDRLTGSGWHRELKRRDLVRRYVGYVGDLELDEPTFEKYLRHWALILSSDELAEYLTLKKKPWIHPDDRNRFHCLQKLFNDETKSVESLTLSREALDATSPVTAAKRSSLYKSRGEREVPDDGSFGQPEEVSTFESDKIRQDSPYKRGGKPHKERSRKSESHVNLYGKLSILTNRAYGQRA